MFTKRKKNAFLKLLASGAFMLALAVLAVWLGVSTLKELYGRYQIRREINQFKGEIKILEEKNKNLSSFIESFKNSDVIEREAKRRLNLKNPDEEVAVILRPSDDSSPAARDGDDEHGNIINDKDSFKEEAPLASDKISEELSNPLKWWRYITK